MLGRLSSCDLTTCARTTSGLPAQGSIDCAAEISPTHPKRGQPPTQRLETRVSFAALDAADVVPMEVGGESERLLRMALLLPKCTKHRAECPAMVLVGLHCIGFASCTLCVYTL